MCPNIKNKEIIIGGRDAKCRRGDVIVCCTEDYNRKKIFIKRKNTYIKRVIGFPGEEINIKNGKVYINNEELQEEYLPQYMKTTSQGNYPITIPKGYVFVMGDNRSKSIDSRSPSFGLIKDKNIIATCFTKFGAETGAIK